MKFYLVAFGAAILCGMVVVGEPRTPERSLEDEVERLECFLDVHKEFFTIRGSERWSAAELELAAILENLERCASNKRPQKCQVKESDNFNTKLTECVRNESLTQNLGIVLTTAINIQCF